MRLVPLSRRRRRRRRRSHSLPRVKRLCIHCCLLGYYFRHHQLHLQSRRVIFFRQLQCLHRLNQRPSSLIPRQS
jgi:hypothetical protein